MTSTLARLTRPTTLLPLADFTACMPSSLAPGLSNSDLRGPCMRTNCRECVCMLGACAHWAQRNPSLGPRGARSVKEELREPQDMGPCMVKHPHGICTWALSGGMAQQSSIVCACVRSSKKVLGVTRHLDGKTQGLGAGS